MSKIQKANITASFLKLVCEGKGRQESRAKSGGGFQQGRGLNSPMLREESQQRGRGEPQTLRREGLGGDGQVQGGLISLGLGELKMAALRVLKRPWALGRDWPQESQLKEDNGERRHRLSHEFIQEESDSKG